MTEGVTAIFSPKIIHSRTVTPLASARHSPQGERFNCDVRASPDCHSNKVQVRARPDRCRIHDAKYSPLSRGVADPLEIL